MHIVDCGVPISPAYSMVTLTGTLVGFRATYRCEPGYRLVGDTTVVCQADGSWSGSATCLRMWSYISAKPQLHITP